MRVLICDDALFMRTLLKDLLTAAGCTVVGEADNGAAAIEQYHALAPDFMTLDIVMPGMGGLDALQEIRATDPQATIIMCSAMGQETLIAQAMRNGATAFIVKPFQPAAVQAAVAQATLAVAARLASDAT